MPKDDNFKAEADAAALWINGVRIGIELSMMTINVLVARNILTAGEADAVVAQSQKRLATLALPNANAQAVRALIERYREDLRD